jgi:hypothetical protein
VANGTTTANGNVTVSGANDLLVTGGIRAGSTGAVSTGSIVASGQIAANGMTLTGTLNAFACCVCLCHGDQNGTGTTHSTCISMSPLLDNEAFINLAGTVDGNDRLGLAFFCDDTCASDNIPTSLCW